uniref:Uncharacterized protein n=1 Tax=Glossina pallidipes TaxID=7398 RepID=A0A1A9ZIG5_GLOPL
MINSDVRASSLVNGIHYFLKLRTVTAIAFTPTTLCKLPRGTLDELNVCSEVGRFINTLNGSEDNPGYEVGGKALATDAVEPNDIVPRQRTFYRSMYMGTANFNFELVLLWVPFIMANPYADCQSDRQFCADCV